jgi:hypothetical protein
MDVSLVVHLLSLAKNLWSEIRGKEPVDHKQDEQMANAALQVLGNTETGRALFEQIRALPEEEANKLWEEMLSHGTTEPETPVATEKEIK